MGSKGEVAATVRRLDFRDFLFVVVDQLSYRALKEPLSISETSLGPVASPQTHLGCNPNLVGSGEFGQGQVLSGAKICLTLSPNTQPAHGFPNQKGAPTGKKHLLRVPKRRTGVDSGYIEHFSIDSK